MLRMTLVARPRWLRHQGLLHKSPLVGPVAILWNPVWVHRAETDATHVNGFGIMVCVAKAIE